MLGRFYRHFLEIIELIFVSAQIRDYCVNVHDVFSVSKTGLHDLKFYGHFR